MQKKRRKTARIFAWVSPEHKDLLRRLAEAMRRSETQVLEIAIEHLAEQEHVPLKGESV